jgi:ABC-type spermidine/putrescine transport system permease subunit II
MSVQIQSLSLPLEAAAKPRPTRRRWSFNSGATATVAVLVLSYAFLYLPILHVAVASVSSNYIWPYPPRWSFAAFSGLAISSVYRTAFLNSVELGVGSALLSTALATAAMFGLTRNPGGYRVWLLGLFLAPLFIADVLQGISSLVFNRLILGLPGNLASAVLANAVHCFTYAFLIIATQLYRYNWRLNEAAQVFGATPFRTFFEVTLPLTRSGILAALITTFIIAFNNLEISFYLLGATPTLPSVAWGTLRFGIKPELYALATSVNVVVLLALAVAFVVMRARQGKLYSA